MSFREDILEAIEDVRDVPGDLDIRQWRVFIISRTWSGDRVGLPIGSSPTTTTTELLVSGYPPKVKEVSIKDIVASAGLYQSGDVRVGPITPSHPAGGTSPTVFDPTTSASPTEIYFLITGPGLPSAGARFERVGDETFKNFSYYLTLRQTGRVAT